MQFNLENMKQYKLVRLLSFYSRIYSEFYSRPALLPWMPTCLERSRFPSSAGPVQTWTCASCPCRSWTPSAGRYSLCKHRDSRLTLAHQRKAWNDVWCSDKCWKTCYSKHCMCAWSTINKRFCFPNDVVFYYEIMLFSTFVIDIILIIEINL